MRHLVFLFLLFGTSLFAQNGRDANSTAIPHFTLKTNLGILISPAKQAFAFTTDIRVAPRFSIDVGAGAFFNSLSFAQFKDETYTGLRLRGGFKYYFDALGGNPFHVGVEFKYNGIKNLNYREILRQGGQYVETRLTDRRVKTVGVAARIGWHFFVGKRDQFLVEPFMGLGLMRHDVSFNLPPDAEVFQENGLFSFEYGIGKSTTPDVLLGLHFGYVFW